MTLTRTLGAMFILAIGSPALSVSKPNLRPMCGGLWQRVCDWSGLKCYKVNSIAEPKTIAELQRIIRGTNLPVSVRGGGYSQGGQVIAEDGLVVKMDNLNRIKDFDPDAKRITVEAG